MKVINGIEFIKTHHCVTGSMKHVFDFYKCGLTEEMLLGLGSGVGFIYWQMKGSEPFMGGRANVGRSGNDTLEITTAERCGIKGHKLTTASKLKAENRLLELLEKDIPVVLQLDMGFLPYLGLPEGYHFGYHVVAAVGYDSKDQTVTVADRDGRAHTVSLQHLALARGSKYKPFPPQNAWLEYDFSEFHPPEKKALLKALTETTESMINPPIKNIGIKGISTASNRIKQWPEVFEESMLLSACFNCAIMISADGGTGGGLFRYMYSRFLQECAEVFSYPMLVDTAISMKRAGDQWERLSKLFYSIKQITQFSKEIENILDTLNSIEVIESEAWNMLAKNIDDVSKQKVN